MSNTTKWHCADHTCERTAVFGVACGRDEIARFCHPSAHPVLWREANEQYVSHVEELKAEALERGEPWPPRPLGGYDRAKAVEATEDECEVERVREERLLFGRRGR